MLINIETLQNVFAVKPRGTLHVGAHLAEEADEYEQFFFTPVIWVEAQANLISHCLSQVQKYPKKNHEFFQGVIWNKSDVLLSFNVANNGQSSSIFEFGSHKQKYPEIEMVQKNLVNTTTLEKLIPKNLQFDFINLDIQGAELQALEGLGPRIRDIKWIYTEVNKEALYENISLISDLDEFLIRHNFKRVVTKWVYGAGWGDSLYIRKDIYSNLSKKQILQIKFTKIFIRISIVPLKGIYKKVIFEWKSHNH